MAATITLVDGGSYIEIQYSALHKVTVPKLGLKTKLKNSILMLFWDSSFENKSQRPWIELNYEEITSPVVGSAAALRTLILGWIDTQPSDDGSGGSYYVGKPSNGDFITAYTSATTITFSGLPSDVTDITDEDIELVRQISTAGTVTAEYERGDAAMSVTANVLTITGAAFVNTDTFVVYTNIPGASGSSEGGGINPDYKIPAYGGTATYASSTTITLAGAYPTINDSSQIIYIKYVDETLNTADIFYNGVSGVLIEHAAGTLTIVNAGTPFAATNAYEVGLSSVPIGDDISLDVRKTSVQNPSCGHYTDVEHISESDLGIDGIHSAGASATVFTDAGEVYTAETVAEGHLIWNIDDAESALVTVGGAGDPTADDITHVALSGAAQWAAAEVASIPEVKRFEIDAQSFPLMSIHAKITAGATNTVFMTVWASNNADADTTSDDNWVDFSADILSSANINAAAMNTTEGIYIVDTPTIVLKYMIKLVAENTSGVQDNDFDIYIKKGY